MRITENNDTFCVKSILLQDFEMLLYERTLPIFSCQISIEVCLTNAKICAISFFFAAFQRHLTLISMHEISN